VIVRHSLAELPQTLDEVGASRPFSIASRRWAELDLGVEPNGRWDEIPSDRIAEIAGAAGEADCVLTVGGGSAIDLAKAVSAETRLPLVSVPTTYSGAEWTPFFGIRDAQKRMTGGGRGANLAAIVYDVELTFDLPRAESVGTAMNALAHCAEALYVEGRNDEGDGAALAGARAIGAALPRVAADGQDRAARAELLRGAEAGGRALASAGLGLGHAIAQALGGRYGLPHGAMNALSLPLALRFNEPVAHEEIARLADALETDDAVARTAELARLGGFERLREFGVPEDELDDVAEAVVARPGAEANPRPSSAHEVAELLHSIY
jgi:maleylacetate reductase